MCRCGISFSSLVTYTQTGGFHKVSAKERLCDCSAVLIFGFFVRMERSNALEFAPAISS